MHPQMATDVKSTVVQMLSRSRSVRDTCNAVPHLSRDEVMQVWREHLQENNMSAILL